MSDFMPKVSTLSFRHVVRACLAGLIAGGAVAWKLSVQPAAQSTGLVAAYAFDEASGSSVNDASGLGNNGTIQGATRVAGKSGSALSFNGTSDLVTIANAASLNP